ncbi:MAG: SprT-like family protein [Gemmatimonadota bacterium]|nr:SprT-like family protein [Candidatus Palauibacter soopunensis]
MPGKRKRKRGNRTRRRRSSCAEPLLDPGRKQIDAWTREIGRELLAASPWIDAPDFTAIHPDDLAFLFRAYDRRFLMGFARRRITPEALAFRLSSRMTRAGGKTSRRVRTDGTVDYEIAVSTEVLFNGFADGDPPVSVAGIPCANRLEALQRIFEHEIVHLVEFVRTGESNCGARPFQELAHRLFRHRHHTHTLITRVERAAQRGIRVGSRVAFMYQGERLLGRVNRVTKRATVLVEDPEGDRYSDGGRYRKYYVPLAGLELAEGG